MLTAEPVVIDIIQDIDIMYQDGLVVTEQSLCLFQSSTRLQQFGGLVADEDVGGERKPTPCPSRRDGRLIRGDG